MLFWQGLKLPSLLRSNAATIFAKPQMKGLRTARPCDARRLKSGLPSFTVGSGRGEKTISTFSFLRPNHLIHLICCTNMCGWEPEAQAPCCHQHPATPLRHSNSNAEMRGPKAKVRVLEVFQLGHIFPQIPDVDMSWRKARV